MISVDKWLVKQFKKIATIQRCPLMAIAVMGEIINFSAFQLRFQRNLRDLATSDFPIKNFESVKHRPSLRLKYSDSAIFKAIFE